MPDTNRPNRPRPAVALALPLGAALLFACRSGAPTPDAQGAGAPIVREASGPRLPDVPPPLPALPSTTYEAAGGVELPALDPEDHAFLHNVFELSENVISGSEPTGEAAFRMLAEKGVKTILSVDGKVPDADLAAEYGMRYVHVPIQYKGITEDEVAKIVKTFREQEGPFFVHCFHGKHRGPAAAALGRLVLDGLPREKALAEMRQYCGTSPAYEGLYATVAYADVPAEWATRAMDWDFPAAEPVEGVAGGMVVVARAWDHLKAASKNGWQPDPTHPDLNARNEAAKLAGHLARTSELEEVGSRPDDFRGWMADSVEQASTLRDLLDAMGAGEAEVDEVQASFEALKRTCASCHDVYRN